jgi:hypothetical protein
MCEAIEDSVFLPLGYNSGNHLHVAFIATLRDHLKTFLKEKKFSPKKEAPVASRFRDNLLFEWASLLVSEGLKDGNNEPVSIIDTVAFAHWLYHGFSLFKDLVVHKGLEVSDFKVKTEDGIPICSYKAQSVSSKYLMENWCSWSSKQLGRLCSGQPKNLYKEFAGIR